MSSVIHTHTGMRTVIHHTSTMLYTIFFSRGVTSNAATFRGVHITYRFFFNSALYCDTELEFHTCVHKPICQMVPLDPYILCYGNQNLCNL